ncbi:MAG: hypothetical protein LQ352_006171 [Teloschistes flavicans]|nr:MAG: hypothetical protein LQ352_006171 [Teloschistes flavicans]
MTESTSSHTTDTLTESTSSHTTDTLGAARLVELKQQMKELAKSPLYRLPTEILMNVVERIDLVNFPPFLIGAFHLLRQRGLVPNYPSKMLKIVLLPEEKEADKEELSSASLASMPSELILAIGQTLSTHEKIHLILATYRMSDEEIKIITHMSKAEGGKIE